MWAHFCILLGLTAVLTHAQPSQGKLLIAAASLHDPDFAKAVVLLVHCDRQAAIGLMINHPTKVPLSDVFKRGSTFFYAGGPVQFGTNALLRSRDGKQTGEQVLPGVYLIAPIAAARGGAGRVG